MWATTFDQAMKLHDMLDRGGCPTKYIAEVLDTQTSVVDLRNARPCPECNQPMEHRATYVLSGGDPNKGYRFDYCHQCKKHVESDVE